jgi:hypothetical protein
MIIALLNMYKKVKNGPIVKVQKLVTQLLCLSVAVIKQIKCVNREAPIIYRKKK